MLLPDTSRLITSAGRAARWPFEVANADQEAVGLVRMFMAAPQGMVDLATGLVATRSGSADPGRMNADGSLDAYFDGVDDQYSFSTDGAAVSVSTAFTVVWEAELDSFSDTYPILVHFRTGLSNSPLRIFYSSDTGYDDITVGYDSSNKHAFLMPSGISRTGERHWGVWSYNGQGFTTTGNHRLWINGQDCSITTATSLASVTDDNRVGGSSAATSDWNGSIRQVRLYDREWAQDEAIRFWHPSSRDSLFRQPSPITFFSTSGGDIVVSGGAATSATGSLGPSLSASVEGSSTTAAAGALTPSVGATAALSGSSTTSAAGAVSPDLSLGLGGGQATAATGNLDVSGAYSAPLTANQVSSAAGLVSPSISAALAGTQTTTAAGTLTAVVGASAALSASGVTAATGPVAATLSVTLAAAQISSAVGSLSPNLTVAIVGAQSTTAVGTPSATTGATASLSGVQVSSATGALSKSVATALSGCQSTTFAGALGKIAQVSGQVATTSVGTLNASSEPFVVTEVLATRTVFVKPKRSTDVTVRENLSTDVTVRERQKSLTVMWS